MKKLFAILAVASLVVACGGGNAKDEPKSIEDQLLEHLAKMEKAIEAKDREKTSEACDAFREWENSLDEKQSEELHEIIGSTEEYWTILGAAGDAVNYGYDEICEDYESDVPMVYSKSYDGYLNVRAGASTTSQVLGKLRNGEAAELLSIEGKWTKVRVNGIEGYIWSADTQSYPSDPVYIDASAVVGEWAWCDENAHFDSCTIESKGDFYMSGYLSMEASGKWHLSGSDIVLEYEDGKTHVCTVTDNAIIINGYEYYK